MLRGSGAKGMGRGLLGWVGVKKIGGKIGLARKIFLPMKILPVTKWSETNKKASSIRDEALVSCLNDGASI